MSLLATVTAQLHAAVEKVDRAREALEQGRSSAEDASAILDAALKGSAHDAEVEAAVAELNEVGTGVAALISRLEAVVGLINAVVTNLVGGSAGSGRVNGCCRSSSGRGRRWWFTIRCGRVSFVEGTHDEVDP